MASGLPTPSENEMMNLPFFGTNRTSLEIQTGQIPAELSDQLSSYLDKLRARLGEQLEEIFSNSDFLEKYDLSSPRENKLSLYAFTAFSKPYRYTLEVFPRLNLSTKIDLNKGPESFTFHQHFENVIERYTLSNRKPNQALQETRSTDFCYPLTLHIEAIPLEKAKKPHRLLLLREFQILVRIWEQFRDELNLKKCTVDHLVGFPMPFEFCCVTNTEMDLPFKTFESYTYYDVRGNLVDIKSSFNVPLSDATSLKSTLSYMTVEKLGPNVSYLIDLVKSQSKQFSLSSALMIYDQLLCRLFILHKYGVVHGDLNTDCLRFGSGNACNVLYISDFSNCVVMPSKSNPVFLFHDRFASTQRIKYKDYHFLHDLESAYYIFLLMAFGYLPWDSKLKPAPYLTQLNGKGRESNLMTEMTITQKEKENFWENQGLIKRLINTKEFELKGQLYHNFIEDLMITIYLKMRDVMSLCSRVSQQAYITDILIHGPVGSNPYLELRKLIASYFRYETLNPVLSDASADVKIAILRAHDPKDKRCAWDLSFWCWNSICIDTSNRVIKQIRPDKSS